jgi:hypothetical protein
MSAQILDLMVLKDGKWVAGANRWPQWRRITTGWSWPNSNKWSHCMSDDKGILRFNADYRS